MKNRRVKPHKCFECGETAPSKFRRDCKSRCRACRNKALAVSRQLDPTYAIRQAAFYKEWYAKNGRKRSSSYADVIVLWQKDHPECRKAMGIVRAAINNGLLKRPLHCVACGKEGRINGHHGNYNSPYAVLWVCSSCHKKLHQRRDA